MPTTATITPTLGSAPVTLQAGNYSAIDDRRAWSYRTVESVANSDAYKVIQRAAGANMTVDVQSSNGDAIVTGDSVTGQGNYTIPRTAANVNVDIAAADATNPRNDLVVLEVKDDQHDAGGLNLARVRVITGTPNASAAATDAPGANGTPALPSSCQLLAVVRVPAGVTSVITSYINDRRVVNSMGAWTSFTPSWTASGSAPAIGSGTLSGAYMQIGKLVHVRFTLKLAADSTLGSGTYYLSTPIKMSSSYTYTTALGPVTFTDVGTASYVGMIIWETADKVRFLSSAVPAAGVTNTAPFAWSAAGLDEMIGSYTFEAA